MTSVFENYQKVYKNNKTYQNFTNKQKKNLKKVWNIPII